VCLLGTALVVVASVLRAVSPSIVSKTVDAETQGGAMGVSRVVCCLALLLYTRSIFRIRFRFRISTPLTSIDPLSIQILDLMSSSCRIIVPTGRSVMR
jgi:hypothetical protein